MINNELSIEVARNSNLKVIRIFDTSNYHKDEKVDNYLIEVLPVNSKRWLTFNVNKYFSLVLNSSNLRYKVVSDVKGLMPLPDGIYEIKQSYKPNLSTVVHYYHFRVQQLLNDISTQKDKLLGDKCSISREEYRRNRDTLRDIEEYTLAAQWAVEECGDKKRGKELYDFAKKLLEGYTNECQCK